MTRSALITSALWLMAAPAAWAGVDPQVLQAESQRIAVMAKAKDAVLAVFSPDQTNGGSGVVISPDGYALTNFHVVAPCGPAMKCGMSDGRLYDAVLVGIDPTGDVALIRLFGRTDFPAATLGNSDEVAAGDWVFAMGNPFLLASNLQPTVTYGIVSGTHRYQYPSGTILEYTDCIQIDASINPGNSGGPLFDSQGRLIGINGRASFEKRGRVNVGVAYAISINQIKNFMGFLQSGRVVDHATLGAVVAFDEQGRVTVSDILQDCDAYRRGLRYDDEIVSVAGRPISTPNGFKNILGTFPKGWRIPLSYRRDGQRHEILVRLAGLHSEADLLQKAEGRPTMPMPLPEPKEKRHPDKPKQGDSPDKQAAPKDLPEPSLPQMLLPTARQQAMPDVVKAHFEPRHGYANYYFNRTQRDRVMGAWNNRTGLSKLVGTWILSGPLTGGGTFRFELGDIGAKLQSPAGESKWLDTEEISSASGPPGSGGLLAALYLWRRLALDGPARLGDVYYLGTAPFPGHSDLADVLVVIHGSAECRLYFDRADGTLLALELYSQENSDPCEIRFSEDHAVGDRYRPQRMEVRLGDELFGTFQLEHFDGQTGTGS